MNYFLSRLFTFVSVCVAVLGFYTGIWIMLIGGIVDIIEQIKAQETNSLIIARGVVNIIFFEIPIVIGIGLGITIGRLAVLYANKK